MKRLFVILPILILTVCVYSQSISVSSFKLLGSDLTANTSGTTERDQNGEVAALIKVVTTQTGFTFDCGALGIVKTKQTPGEVWVYIPHGAKKITIKHPQLGVLRDYYFPISIETARTYEMVLVSGSVQTVVKQARTSQFVIFQLSPANAQVELDGTVLETIDGTATKMIKFGTYNYRVQAPNYLPEAGVVTIDDPKNKKLLNIKLKPNFSQVIVNVSNNAEIWINGIKKGRGTWTGTLGKGTYEFEAKEEGHRSTIINKDIIVTNEPLTINLQAPIPIYGEIEINSKPAIADFFIDGKKYGQTPIVLSNIIIGEHQLRISKNGYDEYNCDISVKEGETTSINALLKKQLVPQSSLTHDHTSDADVEVFDVVEQMPSFPGGPSAMYQWLNKNLRYPKECAENGIMGRVFVSFIVERDGCITEINVIRSVDPQIDKEAIRLIKSMPSWEPGKNGGEPVRVNYTVPISFK